MGSTISSTASRNAGDKPKTPPSPKDHFLFSIYHPNGDTAEAELFREVNYERDVLNFPTHTSPPYSPSERLAVEHWRRHVGRAVDARIALYRTRKQDVISSTNEQRPGQRTEHSMFQIPELLDIILDYAGPEAQIRAISISTAWRASAISTIGSLKNVESFRSQPGCAPTQYGNIVDWESQTPLQPDSDEITQFGLHAAHTLDRRAKARFSKYIYFPAYFVQSPDLPNPVAHSLNDLDVSQRDDTRHDVWSVSRDEDLYWLDLSQFRTNPYFELLFSEDRFQRRLGRWEISLRAEATSNSLLIDKSAPNQVLLQAIRSMQIVHPPCKSLGIYRYEPGMLSQWGTHTLWRRLRRDDGIRIGDLVGALQDGAPALLSSWLEHAEKLRERINDAHWIDDLWRLPGTPSFRVYLDSTDMSDEQPSEDSIRSMTRSREVGAVAAQLGYPSHITRMAYMSAEPFRATREGEWVPKELFEPMKSETERHPINWDT